MNNYTLLEHMAVGMGNAIAYDTDEKNPGWYVPIEKTTLAELLHTDSSDVHPAFIVEGEVLNTVYLGKYSGVLRSSRMYSLPMEEPGYYITFGDAIRYCAAKGAGHHMMTLAERALVLLICKKNGYSPKGNNAGGRDAVEKTMMGIPCTYDTEGNVRHILEGTGNSEYFHTGNQRGIYGLNGNVCSWIAGYRTVDGEIQIIPDNDAANNVEQGENSTLWRAILADGTLTEPGTAGTLKWNYLNGVITLDTVATAENANHSTPFASLAVNTVNLPGGAPLIMKALGLFPDGSDSLAYGGAMFSVNTGGERMAYAGASYSDGGGSAWSLNGTHERTYAADTVGVRPAFFSAANAGFISLEIDENGQLVSTAAPESGFMSFEIDANGQLAYSRAANVSITFDLEEGVLIANG